MKSAIERMEEANRRLVEANEKVTFLCFYNFLKKSLDYQVGGDFGGERFAGAW